MPRSGDQSTSFIPNAPGRTNRRRRGMKSDTLTLISVTVLFLLVVAGWIAIEIYGNLMQEKLQAKKGAFEEQREQILAKDSDLNRLIGWGSRIDAATMILDRHIAPVRIFDELERVTKEGVQFTSFSFSGNPISTSTVQLSGKAHNYATIIRQREAFRNSAFFASPVFSLPTPGAEEREAGAGVTEPEGADGGAADSFLSFSVSVSVSPQALRVAADGDTQDVESESGDAGTTERLQDPATPPNELPEQSENTAAERSTDNGDTTGTATGTKEEAVESGGDGNFFQNLF